MAPPATTKLTSAQQTALAREKISTDLKAWKERTTSLASKGLEHVRTQVRQVVEDIAHQEKPSGEDMLARLESVASEQLYTLTQDLYSIIQAIPEEYTQEDEDKAQDAFLQRLRESSHAIRGMAHSLRLWFNKYQETLTDAVTKTINITLDVLENARELGLQEIGMRWTAIDGVTYTDWASYYELKSDLGEWKDDIRQAGLQHDSFVLAKDAGENIVARGMDIALDAARQLAEIRSIGKLKIEAGDTTRQLNVDHINDEMIEKRKKYMITSVTSTPTVAPTPPEISDASEMFISNETEAGEPSESPVAEIPVAESLEAEVETPPGEEYVGEQPKSALLEETISSDETLEPQPTPEAPVILDETATAVIPEGSSPGFTSMVEEPASSDPANSGKSDQVEFIDVIEEEQFQVLVGHETPDDTIQADETVSLPSSLTSSTPETKAEAPVSVTQVVEDVTPNEPEDTLSQTTEHTQHTPSKSLGEPVDVHEMVGSATDKIISLVDSAKAGLSETPLPKNEADTLMQDASTKLGDIVSSVQSSISSLEATPPSESSAPEQRREHIKDEISRLTAALEAAQAALLELYRSDEPGQLQEPASDETTHEYNEGH